MPTTRTELPFACENPDCPEVAAVHLIEVDDAEHRPICLACKHRMAPVRPPSAGALPQPPGVG